VRVRVDVRQVAATREQIGERLGHGAISTSA
jgi:hypothetical protein